jgi:predicted peptidase
MKRYITILVWLLSSFCVEAQEFKPMEHNGLLYQEMANRTSETEPPALIIYLHGKHASGNDNQKQLNQTGVRNISEYIEKNRITAYFLVPQCPEDHEWDGRDDSSSYADEVEELIAFYLSTKDVDTCKIYICGVSMGACGCWKLLNDKPNQFAAALIASGQAHRAYPSDFTATPLYVTVGSNERSYDALTWFTSQIQKEGGNVRFDVLKGLEHREACDKAFSAKRIKWLFSQVRD